MEERINQPANTSKHIMLCIYLYNDFFRHILLYLNLPEKRVHTLALLIWVLNFGTCVYDSNDFVQANILLDGVVYLLVDSKNKFLL